MLGNVLWWIGYMVAGIWLQKFFPGLDALIPGFIICLHEKNRQQTAVIVLLSVIIQEGAGTLPFGLSILWHGVVLLLYYMGVWLFMSGNLVFIALLSLSLGLGRLGFMLLMDFLRGASMTPQGMLWIFLLQTFFTPLLWWAAQKSRSVRFGDANQY
ncbi:MAG: hypothetical protein FWG17_03295 [Desulfovibrionaceae bacterium]|nr:hypothetical protein [Desulfovibrionaceae bacterium]